MMVNDSEPLKAAVITVSDSCARRERQDLSGPAVVKVLEKHGFHIVAEATIPDETVTIQNTLFRLSQKANVVVTTGGTGISARDVTPEATRTVCERLLDGVAEKMRMEGSKKTPFAALSRGVCGVRGRAVILNLPGSPAGAEESLQSVVELLPHIVQLLSGNTEHPQN